ncbi:hypothetical protein G6F57_009003 [Rhizopus arrhizus]|uniref:PUM-HD domain-containing protein n=1 Tax=Rhizopus oryzae TaxID=64495 RepID=A0A9P6X342_RHIOR|nr:hypothetical protein G6F21_008121 [Rhizopus arrhizus]KAG1415454.1 hypothetical protein G6F58_006474 [Rhizopus delemar]KAG0798274.1 hypothetical protein G6F22_004387 [Rhizopus arrhizus]KAG0807805.1 hypothetical protein G6F20_010086 [Rhizopus arrhizus]KAG0824967.1 hypothetical protein G6F19_010053 [Rhizopus arrhizus]
MSSGSKSFILDDDENLINLFNFNSIEPLQTPFTTTNSHSVPVSRRNSSENDDILDPLFNVKLSFNDSYLRKSSFALTPFSNENNTLLKDTKGSFFNPVSKPTPVNQLNNLLLDEKTWAPSYKTNELSIRRYSYEWNPGVTDYIFTQPHPPLNRNYHQQSTFYTPHHSLYHQNQPSQKQNKNFNKTKNTKKLNNNNNNVDRFMDADLNDYIGKLYELCKDQNGCRFLQKKMDKDKDGDLIFNELYSHFNELMIDPFGNYFCQKLLDKCTDEQRTKIVHIASPHLAQAALNIHGTRAVQRLIETISTPEQIDSVIHALNPSVTALIKNLNGNHVIQKCLHYLSKEEKNQFIYDAICIHCVEVASHKHGCCVLQRCFDYATFKQKDQLVKEISKHALVLVQGPFGNYVVQYVLDLGLVTYSESINQKFIGHICSLSSQKFSSNVIEKCIRTALPLTRRLMINELIDSAAMEMLLQDSFANYVIQTSLDYADDDQREQLSECIRPFLTAIRYTPHGKRIYNKTTSIYHKSNANFKPKAINNSLLITQ